MVVSPLYIPSGPRVVHTCHGASCVCALGVIVTTSNKTPSSGQTQKGVCLKNERTKTCSPTALARTKPVQLSAPLSVVCGCVVTGGYSPSDLLRVPLAQK